MRVCVVFITVAPDVCLTCTGHSRPSGGRCAPPVWAAPGTEQRWAAWRVNPASERLAPCTAPPASYQNAPLKHTHTNTHIICDEKFGFKSESQCRINLISCLRSCLQYFSKLVLSFSRIRLTNKKLKVNRGLHDIRQTEKPDKAYWPK